MYNVVVLTENEMAGSVAGSGLYEFGTSGTITAIPNHGYVFKQWNDGSIDNPRQIVINQDTSLIAMFEEKQIPNYLCFTAISDSATISLKVHSGNAQHFSQNIKMLYSIDNCEIWNAYNFGQTISLKKNKNVYFRAKSTNTWSSNHYYILNNIYFSESDAHFQFEMTGQISAKGNIMSLCDSSLQKNVVAFGQFRNLFANCSSLLTAPELPATSIGGSAYRCMFMGCTNLKHAPELPAMIVQDGSYAEMFRGCINLQEVPELPATTISQSSYQKMFFGCTSIKYPAVLPATIIHCYSYNYMFYGCTSIHISTRPSKKPWHLPFDASVPAPYSCPYTGNSELIGGQDYGCSMFSQTGDGWSYQQPTVGAIYYLHDNYVVNVEANDTLMGYIVGGKGLYDYMDTLRIIAVPNEHCHFVGWSNGETNDTLSLEVLNDTSLIAYFEYDTIEVSAKVNIDSAGHIIGGGMYEYNSEVTLTAIPETNHSFICWHDGDTNRSINFTVLQDTMVEAFFDERPYKVSATASYENCIVLGSGYYERNSIVTLTAKSNNLFRFVRWSNGSTDSIVQFNVISDTSFIAYYEHTPYDYLYFKAIDGPASVSLTKVGNPNAISLQYSIDNCISWNTYSINQTIQLEDDGKVYFKATTTNSIFSPSDKNLYKFVMTGNVAAGGNVMSLLDETLQQTNVPNYAFCELFSGCSSLITPPLLPATSVGYGGYAHMFAHCGNLKYAPNLPATSLGGWCYSEIFQDCSSIYVNLSGTGTQWSIPSNAVTQNGWGYQMFVGTSGTLRGAPTVGQIYYMQGLHNVSVSVNDTNMGVVIGGGQYYDGATVTLIAIAKPNCHFVNWSNGKTSPTINVTVFGDSTLTATFAPNETYLFGETDTICQGETYSWRNRNLTAAGVYYDSLKTVSGCDSVYELTLTVNPTYFFQETYSICQGETYNWRSKSLANAGVYYDSLLTAVGCDSVYELSLAVNPTYFFSETYSICQGETYNWRNKSLTNAGVYYDSLQTAVGCDSVYELILIVNPTYLFQETHSICQGETYSWRNRNLTTAGVYYDSLTTRAGCDSVYELTLTVNPTYFFQETHSICQGETYSWRTRDITTVGVYYDSLQTVSGCDSVYELTLTVNPTYFFSETYSICQGETYNWRNKSLTNAGVYYDSLQTTAGCDSVYELTLTVNPTYFFSETHSICQDETYNWRSKSLANAGVYYDSLTTLAGCDSVYELTLTVNPTYIFPETYSICQGETYNWRNRNLTAAGVYYDSLQTVAGCDSVYKLTLTVNPTYLFQETYSICQGETYSWRTRDLTTAGVYYDSLQTAAGCDSVYELTLTANPTYFFSEMYSICQGETYNWRNKSLTNAGVYYDSLQTVEGCDSVYELTLTVNPTYLFQETYSICQGETYSWRNKSLTNAGVYYDSLLTAVGCDSVYKLTLTVNPTYFFSETYSICQGETYNWRNRNLSTAGVYYDSLQTIAGCDSIYELTLTVNPTYLFQETYSICQGETYTWRGRNLTTSGVYYDSLKTVAGCDSVYELTLTVNPTYLFQETHAICQGETYSWRTKNLTTTGVYYDSLKTVAGCDSVYELTLTVNPTYFFSETYSICQGETYNWRNKALSTAGVYYDSLQTTVGCDSVYELTLTVNPTYLIPETYSICQGETYNWRTRNLTTSGVYYDSLKTVIGCDSVYELTLTVNPTYLFQETYSICQGETYTWRNKVLSTAGVYYDSLKTVANCDSVYELTLTVNPTYLFQETYSICQGETYNWRNKALSTAGVYYDSLKTTVGCDSVYELTLTVNPTYFFPETYSICQGETYNWRNKSLSVAGVYYDSLKTTVGCDSVYELTLTVNSTYLIPETYSICQGETYNWRTKNLTTSGVYYDSLKTTVGCDSVYELTLTVNPTYFFPETHAICQGETYTWRGRDLTTSGVFYDSLKTVAGCDSVYELTLTVNPTYFFPETYSICQGETYTWRNRSLTTAGVCYDSLKTVAGCDSVYELTLTVNPTYIFPETYSICQGETYNWRNGNLTAAGVYYDSLQTVEGCDSVYELTLTVNPTYLFQETYSICQGETYSWRNKSLANAGVYYDSLQTTAGCDSVYELTLTVNPTYLFQETYSICQGETYSWRNRNLSTAGVYYDSLQTVAGCDSVYELTLTVNPTYFFPETFSICQGETYSWRTRDITTAGVYYDSLQTVAGCDSVYKLTLTVNPTYLFQETYSICQGETYNWRNKSLTNAGVYYDSLQTVTGCDSVYELTLTVNPTYFFPETYSICQGETYNWRNKSLTNAGVYYDSLQTTAGCDSVYELTLTVNPTYLFQETYSICQGETYNWRNRNLTTAGVYYDSLQTTVGCDSVYELTLTVNPTYLIQETYSICQGETYNWRNKSLTTAGVYYDSLQTTAGCDSVYELTLTVNPTYLIQETYSICQGETYNWRNRNLTTVGVYYDSLQTAAGCDSVYKLTLTINPIYTFPETYSICQGETYSWRNKSLANAGVYYDSLQTVAGCDSVYELTLTVNPTYFFSETYSICQGETYNWRNKSLTNAGVYYDSLQTTAGCDSVYELTLTVNPTYLIQQTYSICQGETYNWRNRDITTAGIYYDSLQTVVGCDSVYELTLTVNPTYFIQESDVICHGDVYNWHSMRITDAGIYYDSLKTMAGCDSVYELTLTINNYNVSVNVNDVNGGKSYLYIDNAEALSAVVECGETVELHAEAFTDYHFVEWSDGTTDSIRNVEVVGDTSLVAMFEPNCGEWANWPVAFKYNSLLILNVDSIYSMGYYPTPEDVAWYKVIGNPDDLDDIFPADDQYICNGYYMSLITNNLSYGQYYAVVDVSKNAGVLCHDKMRTEIVEYAYNGQKTHIELAPTNVKNGDVMTVFGLIPDEETTLMVYDYSGKLIETVKSNGSDKCQITAVGSAGVYVVNVISDSVNETVKFIVTK